MTEQLALIPEALAPSVDHSRTMLAVKVTRTRKVTRPVRWFPGMAPAIRTRKLKAFKARRFRAGRKPQSIGKRPLTDKERAEFELLEQELIVDRVYESRPKTWGDCMPLRCPWCNAETRMAMTPAPSEEYQQGFECPACGKAVRFEEDADGARWARVKKSVPVLLTPANLMAYYRARNHAGSCGWISCRHSAYLDVDSDGAIKINWPSGASVGELGENIEEVPATCTLAVGQQREGMSEEWTLDQIGVVVNRTSEGVNLDLRAGQARLAEGLAEFRP